MEHPSDAGRMQVMTAEVGAEWAREAEPDGSSVELVRAMGELGRALARDGGLGSVREAVLEGLVDAFGFEGAELELAGERPALRGRRVGYAVERELACGTEVRGTLRGWVTGPRLAELRVLLDAVSPWIALTVELEVERTRHARADGRPTEAIAERVAGAAEEWRLTRRQREIVERTAQGMSNKEIANALGCAEVTVENHLTAVFRKAGVDGRNRLVAKLLGG